MGIAMQADLAEVRRLRAAGVLLDIDPTKMDLSKGLIVVRCSDCDQRQDMVGYVESLCDRMGVRRRIHDFALNGGPKVIPIESPLNSGDRRGSSLLEDIEGAYVLKGIMAILLIGHNPCGAALMCDVSLNQAVRLLMQAEGRIKDALQSRIPGLHVYSHIHVDYAEVDAQGREKKRTYFVSHQAWLAQDTGASEAPSHHHHDHADGHVVLQAPVSAD